MLPPRSLKSAECKSLALSLGLAMFLFTPVDLQAPATLTPTQDSRTPPRQGPTPNVPVSTQPPTRGPQHPAETNQGRTPHGSSNGPAIAGAGAAVAGGIIAEMIAHHNASPEKFGHDG